jgi:hypothetical protein
LTSFGSRPSSLFLRRLLLLEGQLLLSLPLSRSRRLASLLLSRLLLLELKLLLLLTLSRSRRSLLPLSLSLAGRFFRSLLLLELKLRLLTLKLLLALNGSLALRLTRGSGSLTSTLLFGFLEAKVLLPALLLLLGKCAFDLIEDVLPVVAGLSRRHRRSRGRYRRHYLRRHIGLLFWPHRAVRHQHERETSVVRHRGRGISSHTSKARYHARAGK